MESAVLDFTPAFDTEDKCVEHLASLRWPSGPVCPHCKEAERINRLRARPLWWCADCKKQFSVRTGTVFEDSKIKLRKWFVALWLLTGQYEDTSTHQMAKALGVTQKTAWLMVERLREALPSPPQRRVGDSRSMNAFGQMLRALAPPNVSHTSCDIRTGDCLNWLAKMEPESIDLVITDPPYFLDGLDQAWTKGKKGKRGTGAIGGLPVGMKFDPTKGRELQAFIGEVGELMLPAMRPGAFAAVFSQPRLAHRMAGGLEDAGFEIRDLLAWHFTKRAQFKAFTVQHFPGGATIPSRYRTPQLRPQFEAVVLAQKPRDGTFVQNWHAYGTGLIDASARLNAGAPSSVMTVEKPSQSERKQFNGHLTVKPLLLVEHLVRLLSKRGQTVLDPFLGSGTTAIAAMKNGRSCIGIEINPDYVDIAHKRLDDMRQPTSGEMPKRGDNDEYPA